MNPVYYVMPPDGQPYTGVPNYIQRPPPQPPHYQGNVLYYPTRTSQLLPQSPFQHNYNNNNIPPGPVPYHHYHHQVYGSLPPHSPEAYRFPPQPCQTALPSLSSEPYNTSHHASQSSHQGSSSPQDQSQEIYVYQPQPGQPVPHDLSYFRLTPPPLPPTPPPGHESFGIPLHTVQPVQRAPQPAQTVLSSARVSPPFQVPPRLKALGDVFASISRNKDSDVEKVDINTDTVNKQRISSTVVSTDTDQKLEDSHIVSSMKNILDVSNDVKTVADINESNSVKNEDKTIVTSITKETAEFDENRCYIDDTNNVADSDCEIEIEEHEFLSSTFECKTYSDSEYKSDEEGNELKQAAVGNYFHKNCYFHKEGDFIECHGDITIEDDLTIDKFANLIVKQATSRAMLFMKKHSSVCDLNQNSIRKFSQTGINSDNDKDIQNNCPNENDKCVITVNRSGYEQNVTDVQNEDNILVHDDNSKQTNDNGQIAEDEVIDDKINMIDVSNDHLKTNEIRPRLYSWSYIDDQEKSENKKNASKLAENGESIYVDIKLSEIPVTSEKTKTAAQTDPDVKNKQILVHPKKTNDFESFYFRQKASRCGIVITSPANSITDRQKSNSGNEDNISPSRNEKLKVKCMLSDDGYTDAIPVDGTFHFRQRFSSISVSSDSGSDANSLDSSQSDAVEDFKQKASRRGIKIVDPNESWDIANENDIESELGATQISRINSHFLGHKNVSLSNSMVSVLNPEVPEFKFKATVSPKVIEPNIFSKSLDPTSKEFQPLTSTSGFYPPVVTEVWDDSHFTQSAVNQSLDMCVDAPEFIPTQTSLSGSPSEDNLLNKRQQPLMLHLKSPKPIKTSSCIATQASPSTTDSCVGTSRIKTKECAINTGSCDTRDVCVNTESEKPSEWLNQRVSPKKPKVSKSTQSAGIGLRSVGVNVKFKIQPKKAEKKDVASVTDSLLEQNTDKAKLTQQIRTLQVELMQYKTREITFKLLQKKEQLANQCNGLIPLFSNSNELDVLKGLIQNRITAIDKSVVAIQVEAEKTILKIQSGEKIVELPDLSKYQVPTTCSSSHGSPQPYMFPTYYPQNYYTNSLFEINNSVENRKRSEHTAANQDAFSTANMSFEPQFSAAVTAFNTQYLTVPNLSSQCQTVPNSVSQNMINTFSFMADKRTETRNVYKYEGPSVPIDVSKNKKADATHGTDKNMENKKLQNGDPPSKMVNCSDNTKSVLSSTGDANEITTSTPSKGVISPKLVPSPKKRQAIIRSDGNIRESASPDHVYTMACISLKLSSPQKDLHSSPMRLPAAPDALVSNDIFELEKVEYSSSREQSKKNELQNELSCDQTRKTTDEEKNNNINDKMNNTLETCEFGAYSPEMLSKNKSLLNAAIDVRRSLSAQDQILQKMKEEYLTSEDKICTKLEISPLKEINSEMKAIDSIDSDEEDFVGNDQNNKATRRSEDSDEIVTCNKDLALETKVDNSDFLLMNQGPIVKQSVVGNNDVSKEDPSMVKIINVESNIDECLVKECLDKVSKENECDPEINIRKKDFVTTHILDDGMDLADARILPDEQSTSRIDEHWEYRGMNDLEEVEPSEKLQYEAIQNSINENDLQLDLESGQTTSDFKVIQGNKDTTSAHKDDNKQEDQTGNTECSEETTAVNSILESKGTIKNREDYDVEYELDMAHNGECFDIKTKIKHDKDVLEICDKDEEKLTQIISERYENMTVDTSNSDEQTEEIMTIKSQPKVEPVYDNMPVNTDTVDCSSSDMKCEEASAVDPQEIFMSPPKPTREIFNDIDTNKTLAVVPSTSFTTEIPPPPLPGQMPVVGGFDTGLYQAVLSQLIQAYPHLAANQVLLTNTAIHQTQLLQMYMKDQQSASVENMSNFPNMPNMSNVPNMQNLMNDQPTNNLPQFANKAPDGFELTPYHISSSFPMHVTTTTLPSNTAADFVSPLIADQKSADSISASSISMQTVNSVNSNIAQGVSDHNSKSIQGVESKGCKKDNLSLPSKANKCVSSPSRPPGIKTVLIDENDALFGDDKTKFDSCLDPNFMSNNDSKSKTQSGSFGLEGFTLPKSKSGIIFQSRATNNTPMDKQSSLSDLEEFRIPKSKKIHKIMDESAEKLIMGIEMYENFTVNNGLTNMNKNESQDNSNKPSGKICQGLSNMTSNSSLDNFSESTKRSSWKQTVKASLQELEKENNAFPFANKAANELKLDANKKSNPWKQDTKKVHKVLNQSSQQVVRSRNSSGGSCTRSTPTPPSSAEVDGSFSFKRSSQMSTSQNKQSSGSEMTKLPNLPPRLKKKYQNTKPEIYVPPNKHSVMSVDSNPVCIKELESWDAEADEYLVKFSLNTDSISKPTMKRKHNPSTAGLKTSFENKENISDITKIQKASQSSAVTNAGLCDIPSPKMTKKETSEKPMEEAEEEWCEVTTKRKRHKSKEQPAKKVSQPIRTASSSSSKQQKMSNFEKLVERLLLEFPCSNRQSVIDAITKIRNQRGSLSGLSMENIIAKAHCFIRIKPKKDIPGLPQPSTKMNSKPSEPDNMFLPQFISKTFSTQQSSNKNILRLPQYIPSLISKSGFEDDEEICVICHDALSMMETKELDCNHVFHFKCISLWAERERTCPTCRQHALFPEDFPRLGK